MVLVKRQGLVYLSATEEPPITTEEARNNALAAFAAKYDELSVPLARELARLAHGDQRYGNDSLEASKCNTHEFVEHLDRLQGIAARFGITDRAILVALYLHDVLEDTALTSSDLLWCGVSFSELALIYACTDGEGATRAEQKAAAYKKIALVPGADVVKVIDRIGNTENTLRTGSEKYAAYQAEFAAFQQAIFKPSNTVALPLWAHLEWLNGDEAKTTLWATHVCSTPRLF